MAAYGLYTQIASNKARSRVLLACLFLLIYVCVFAGALLAETQLHDGQSARFYLRAAGADLYHALPVATIAGGIWMALAWRFNQAIIDAVTGGREVTRQEQPRLYNLLENLCISRGIAMPRLRIIDTDALNAYASGLNPRQYCVTVTSGLLAALGDAEIEAVLGHELTHIRNGDVRLMVIAGIVAGVVGFFAELVFRVVFRSGVGGGRRSSRSGGDGKGAALAVLIAFALIALAWLMSVLIRLALSRSREFLADAGSVELTKNPDAMISALRKIENRGELQGATSAVMEMCIDNPREGFSNLFDTHPTVQARVQALVKTAGGHDPGPMHELAAL
ncbi:MAG: M48 family metallopeptidase [Burkholderiaceae bacterium]|jgi:heat shock protein HtpX|nr:M48 family metallopeptidase [Burkholderiaceae bacterium]